MSKLLMLKGLPASGKSTYAKELVAKGWKRVNKDSLREMIDDGKWSKSSEAQIINSETALASMFLTEGYDVVIDDTNFAHEETWRNVAQACNIGPDNFDIKFFDVPLMECIKRDAKRGDKSVGEKVIYRMWENNCQPTPKAYNPDLEDIYILDIDGTIAKMNGRGPHDYDKVDTDVINKNIVDIVRVLAVDKKMIVVSGRKDECKDQTIKWLKDNEIPFSEIHMRKTGDERNDSIIKREIYDAHINNKYNVLAVFDDRDRVVEMWRGLGLTCLQVDYGNF